MPSVSSVKARSAELVSAAEIAVRAIQSSLDELLVHHRVEREEMEARHQAEISAASLSLGAEKARFDTLRQSHELIASIDDGASRRSRKPSAKRRGRGMSAEWRRWYSQLPVAPAPSMPTGEFIDIVHRDSPDVARNNIRSSLNNAKNKIVEYVDGGWRLIRPLDESGPENEVEAIADASDGEAPHGDADGASDHNPPQFELNARAAA